MTRYKPSFISQIYGRIQFTCSLTADSLKPRILSHQQPAACHVVGCVSRHSCSVQLVNGPTDYNVGATQTWHGHCIMRGNTCNEIWARIREETIRLRCYKLKHFYTPVSKHQMMRNWFAAGNDTQNHWASGPCPSSGILNTGKHNVSETDFFYFSQIYNLLYKWSNK
jgi:hypothetical protein